LVYAITPRRSPVGFRADRSGDSLLAHVRIKARPVGIALSRSIVLLLVLDTGINTARGICDHRSLWPCEGDPSRAAVISKLEHTPASTW